MAKYKIIIELETEFEDCNDYKNINDFKYTIKKSINESFNNAEIMKNFKLASCKIQRRRTGIVDRRTHEYKDGLK